MSDGTLDDITPEDMQGVLEPLEYLYDELVGLVPLFQRAIKDRVEGQRELDGRTDGHSFLSGHLSGMAAVLRVFAQHLDALDEGTRAEQLTFLLDHLAGYPGEYFNVEETR